MTRKLRPGAFRTLRQAESMVLKYEDGEDHLQTAYVRLLANDESEEFAPPSLNYLKQAVRNALIDRHRKDSSWRTACDNCPSLSREIDGVRPEDVVIRREQATVLRRIVAKLDAPYRSTLEAYFFEGLSVAKIAERDGVSPNTVHSRIRRAVEKLRTSRVLARMC